MKKQIRLVFIIIFVLSAYHLVRDFLQMLNFHNFITDSFYRPHKWCGSYCDYATYPLDILGIVGAFIVLKRKKVGFIGILTIALLPIWLPAYFLP